MSTHTKVKVYAEYDCSLGDCGHDDCPTLRLDICEECTREAWEEHEGGAVTWIECLDNLALDEFDVPTDREVCTCPSGDGSLRWPCPIHTPTDREDGSVER